MWTPVAQQPSFGKCLAVFSLNRVVTIIYRSIVCPVAVPIALGILAIVSGVLTLVLSGECIFLVDK